MRIPYPYWPWAALAVAVAFGSAYLAVGGGANLTNYSAAGWGLYAVAVLWLAATAIIRLALYHLAGPTRRVDERGRPPYGEL